MRVAVIGKGTSSIITTLTLIKNGHDVEIFYDPEKSHISVGESTTPLIGNLIFDVLGISIHDLNRDSVASLKSGIKFINWGKNESFQHNFVGSNLAFHFDTTKFNSYIHNTLEENNLVKYHPQKVKTYIAGTNCVSVNGIDYDFIVDCSGWNEHQEYNSPIFPTVNSTILFGKETLDSDFLHTIHRATEDGWQFELPFPKQNISKCGYLYDRNISSFDEVSNKIGKDNIKGVYEWTPKYANKLIQNRFIAFNGNNLFFFEPLQALSLHYYLVFSNFICDYLNNISLENYHHCNHNYKYEIWAYQLSLAFHYSFGSFYTSKFWNKKSDEAKKIMCCMLNSNEKLFLEHLSIDLKLKNTNYSNIGIFSHYDLIQLYAGMNGIEVRDFENYLKQKEI